MGPAATAEFYARLVRATPATRDQEHLPVIIDADPRIPDRSLALTAGGEDPSPWLTASARRLRSAGAMKLICPCNTAATFIRQLAIKDPPLWRGLIHWPEAVASGLRAHGLDAVSIAATRGTVASGIYGETLGRWGTACFYPAEPRQTRIDKLIAEVKAGHAVTAKPLGYGRLPVLLACTELSIAYPSCGAWGLDATDLAARAAVAACYAR
jgi:aspartate racemase